MTEVFNVPSMRHRRQGLRGRMTEAEIILWSRLKCRKLMGLRFRRQYSIKGFVVDFYLSSAKLAIELDGSRHDTPEQEEDDAERQREIESLGITFLRFTNDQVVRSLTNVLNAIVAEAGRLHNKFGYTHPLGRSR